MVACEQASHWGSREKLRERYTRKETRARVPSRLACLQASAMKDFKTKGKFKIRLTLFFKVHSHDKDIREY